MFLMKAYAITGAGNWVTINGTHVLIGGNGKIIKGPAKFIGSTIEEMSKESSDKRPRVDGYNPNNPTGLSRKERISKIRDLEKKFSKLSDEEVSKQLESNKNTMNTSVLGSKEYVQARLNTQALLSIKEDRRNSSLTREDIVKIAGDAVREQSKPTRTYPRMASPTAQKHVDDFYKPDTVGARAKTGSAPKKYPSGITTPAQKRAYTRAINSGMTSSEAKKSALGGTSAKTKSSSDGFKKLTNSQIKKMSTENLLKTHNDYQSKMTVAGFNGNKRLANKYDRESLRLFEEYGKRLSKRK